MLSIEHDKKKGFLVLSVCVHALPAIASYKKKKEKKKKAMLNIKLNYIMCHSVVKEIPSCISNTHPASLNR